MTDRMHDNPQPRVLFVGLGASPLCYYRCALPAMYMGGDWVGVYGHPPDMQTVTGVVHNGKGLDFESYDIVVLQQPRGRQWLKIIADLRERGVLVLYEIDDYVHGIRRLGKHDFAKAFTKADLAGMERCMRACDGMIVSTDYLARRYRKFNPNTYVCENGLDLPRYNVTLPKRAEINGVPSITLGWAGGTGHAAALRPWLPVIEDVMRDRAEVCFATIGQSFASEITQIEQGRVISLPFLALENYAPAMTLFDIALAPADRSGFFAGKSTLRAMEAQALGLPVIASAHYRSALNADAGFIVNTPGDLEDALTHVIDNPDHRIEMGKAGRTRTIGEFAMIRRVAGWRQAFTQAWTQRHGE